MVDTRAPVLAVTNPVNAEFSAQASYTLRGTVDDGAGSGIASLSYSFDYDNDPDNELTATWEPITITGANWSKNIIDLGTEGQKTVAVRTLDVLGYKSIIGPVSFYYDQAAPTLSETSAVLLTAPSGNGVTIGGTAGDSNEIQKVLITRMKDEVAQSTVELVPSAAQKKSFPYTYNAITNNAANDGQWKFTITVVDIAGRSSQVLERTVLLDNTDPATPSINAFAGQYVENSLPASGTAPEGGSDEITRSGIGKVQYRMDNGSWVDANGTDAWFKTVDLSYALADLWTHEGTHLFEVKSIDRVLNESPIVGRNFTIDRADPGFDCHQSGCGISL